MKEIFISPVLNLVLNYKTSRCLYQRYEIDNEKESIHNDIDINMSKLSKLSPILDNQFTANKY